MTSRVAFLGLGTMGGPMATNLARAGFEVYGWNRTEGRASAEAARAAGVRLCASIADAVEGAGFIATCVSDVADVEAVLLGAGAASRAEAGALVIDFSTIGPAAARRIAAQLGPRGLRFLDAPVTGGDVGAKAGTLSVMAGGAEADFAEAGPLLAAVGRRATLCGPVGAGQSVKLCNQVLVALHMVALTEALALARAQGVAPALVVDVCATGAAGSWALQNLGPRLLARDFAPGFMIKHLVKDLRLVLDTPPAQGFAAMFGTQLAADLFEKVARLEQCGGAEGGLGGDLGTQALTLAYEAG
ncbi:MAG: NAD(P)-dependent oxidoreductase [Deltaproteobacteria bacterium]|nr:NAD(P)-dependent oxidoreductase [Deltaproteobacteria bacterium]